VVLDRDNDFLTEAALIYGACCCVQRSEFGFRQQAESELDDIGFALVAVIA